jgi:hypothetical protein
MSTYKLRLAFIVIVIALAGSVAGGQTTLVPFIEMRIGGVIGGVQNGRWVAPDRAAKLMAEQTEFVLVGDSGVEEGGVTLGKLIQPTANEPCDDFYAVETELEMERGVGVGSSAKWKLTTRMPKTISPDNAVYKNIVANFLKTKRISNPRVKIAQAMSVDLDGDGTNEVLLSATFYKTTDVPRTAIGDYSLVLLRTTRGKAVTNHLLAGEFYLKAEEFGAPNTYQISAIADLNGDGRMEVILNSFYYEGNSAFVYEMKNRRPIEVKELGAGCGV